MQEGSGQLVLREIEDRDLGVLFEHSRDRDAIRMAAFTSPEADDRTNFERRWARLRSDGSTTNRVVEIDGRVVGHIASFDLEGHREVTYWIGRGCPCAGGRRGGGCDVCFDELDRYVELEVAGRDADAAIPGLRAHLEGCPACREEHESLYALVSGEQAL